MKLEESYYNGKMKDYLNPYTCQNFEIMVNFWPEKRNI